MIEQNVAQAGSWWLEMPNQACVLDYGHGDETISIAAEFIASEARADGGTDLRFRTFPVSGTIVVLPTEVRLMSNNPEKIAALEKAGIRVVERVPAIVPPQATTEDYLRTKKEKMGHLL